MTLVEPVKASPATFAGASERSSLFQPGKMGHGGRE